MHIALRRTLVGTLLMVAAPMSITAPANAVGIGHSVFMRGSVVGMENGRPTVCVGKADGAKVGQTLTVFRVGNVPMAGGKSQMSYQRREIGSVRINAIIDDHFADTTVIKGDIAKHDIVELRKK